MNDTELIVARGVTKTYSQGAGILKVLKGLNLTILEKDAICIRGASGAGKSTLLHILGTLDRPTQGEIFYRGEDLLTKDDEQSAKFRGQKMGFVFQFHHLLSEFSALENVMMPCRIAGLSKKESFGRAEELLVELGLRDRLTHFPSELSGGEQQRVAIARALVRGPEILFADEPTGNLDVANGMKIQELFFDLKERKGLTLVVVSHDLDFGRRFPRVLTLRDGQWNS